MRPLEDTARVQMETRRPFSELALPAKYSRMGASLFFIYYGLAGLAAGILMIRLSRSWTIADWLINYQGGYIRRGLPGQVAFSLGHLLHVSPVAFVAAFYLSLFAVLVLAVRSIALASSLNVWVLSLIVSPATLSFVILHPQAGFRKELIFLAALAVLAAILRKKSISSLWVVVYLTIVLTVGTLSHEAILFYAPYFFAALVLGGRSVSKAIRECLVPFAAGAIAFYFCSTHMGNWEVAEKVCSSLGYKMFVPGSNEICANGAIPYLVKSREMAQAEAARFIRQFHYLAIYPEFAALALFPAVAESLVLWRRGLKREMRVLWTSAAVTLLASLPLFVFAIDWGRWIYIHVLSIAMLLMLVDRAEKKQLSVARAKPHRSHQHQTAAGIFLLLYATLWSLPVSTEPPRFGYLQRVLDAAHITHEKKTAILPRGE